MYKILKLNEIDNVINHILDNNYEISKNLNEYEAIILRSYKMHNMDLSNKLLCVARAGAGTNNIPIETLKEKGICVFNTPGANANAVKELIIAALINSSRSFVQSALWCENLNKNMEIDKYNKEVENGKKQFAGNEIYGKTLGVIGFGNIGKLVAYSAKNLGMKVIANDTKEETVDSSKETIKIDSLDEVYRQSDYITLHIPLTNSTRELINKDAISKMKNEVIILNYSRGEIVNKQDIIDAVKSGKIKKFYCDFPCPEFQGVENIVCTPHLGASTQEAETVCAKMAANEIKDYLENGNINNSVNMPNLSIKRVTNRITIYLKELENENIVKYITDKFCDIINIKNISTQNKDNYIYLIIDTDSEINSNIKEKFISDDRFIRVRFFN